MVGKKGGKMTVTKTAEQIVNEVENCNRFGNDMHERDKLIAIEIVSKLLTIRDAKVREEGIEEGRKQMQIEIMRDAGVAYVDWNEEAK
jgi:hypothetical protein